MRQITAISKGLLAALFLASCTAAPQSTLVTRNAPPPKPEVARASNLAIACLAEAVYFEARGTGDTGRAAVAHVVVNRAESSKFPNSVCGVVADGCQFSYRCDGAAEQLANPKARENALRTAEAVLTGAPDITEGALFFHSAQASPGWFNTRPRIGKFGGNIFYR